MSKQTAVEWLIQRLHNRRNGIFDGHPVLSEQQLYEQAKAMENQQIIDAFGVGCHHESKRLVGYQDVAEQYYNETYGKEASDE